MISIYDINDNVLASVEETNRGSVLKQEVGGDNCIELHFCLAEPISFGIGAYILLFGRKWEVNSVQKPKLNTSNGGYDYTIKFDAEYIKWRNKLCCYNRQGARETSWTLTSELAQHALAVKDNIDSLGYKFTEVTDTGTTLKNYVINIDTAWFNSSEAKVKHTEPKAISYTDTDIISALDTICSPDNYDCEWWLSDNVICFGKCQTEAGSEVEISEGEEIAVCESSDNTEGYATRFYAFGGERNVPSNYRKELLFDVTKITEQRQSGASWLTKFTDSFRPLYPRNFNDADKTYKDAITFAPVGGAEIVKESPYVYDFIANEQLFTKEQQIVIGEYTLSASGAVVVRITETNSRFALSVNDLYVCVMAFKADGTSKQLARWDGSIAISSVEGGDNQSIYTSRIELSPKTFDLTEEYVSMKVYLRSVGGVARDITDAGEEIYRINLDYSQFALSLANTSNCQVAVRGDIYRGSAKIVENFTATLNSDWSQTYDSLYGSLSAQIQVGDTFTVSNLKATKVPLSYYRTKTSEQMTIEGVVQTRLKLPVGTDYVDLYPNMKTEEAVEKVLVFDDVYPRRIGIMRNVHKSTTQYTDETEYEDGTVSRTFWYPWIFADGGYVDSQKQAHTAEADWLEFSTDYIMAGRSLHVKFESGKLAGMEFEVKFQGDTAQSFEIIRNEDYGVKLPNDVLCPADGDRYILLDFEIGLVGDQFVTNAEQELLECLQAYVAQQSDEGKTYTATMNAVMAAQGLLSFDLGQRVRLFAPEHITNPDGYLSRIRGKEMALDGTSLKYTIGDNGQASRLKSLEQKVDGMKYSGNVYNSVTNNYGAGGGSIDPITIPIRNSADYMLAVDDEGLVQVPMQPFEDAKGVVMFDTDYGNMLVGVPTGQWHDGLNEADGEVAFSGNCFCLIIEDHSHIPYTRRKYYKFPSSWKYQDDNLAVRTDVIFCTQDTAYRYNSQTKKLVVLNEAQGVKFNTVVTLQQTIKTAYVGNTELLKVVSSNEPMTIEEDNYGSH